MTRSLRAFLAALTCCAAGCDRAPVADDTAPSASKSGAVPAARAPTAPGDPTPLSAAAESLAKPPGPAAPGADTSVEQREQAVLELLAGGVPSEDYPLVDVDAGKPFEPQLRDRIAPRLVRGAGAPRVQTRRTVVTGAIDVAIVRRIQRAHVNEVHHCYNQLLVVDARKAGEIDIAFTVDPQGNVADAEASRSTLSGELGRRMATCLVKATKRWRFPSSVDGKPVSVLTAYVLGAD